MLNYLKLEYQKFGKNTVVTMLLFMYMAFLPALIFLGKTVPTIPGLMASNNLFFEFPTVWQWMGYSGNWLVFFCLGYVAVHIITSEVSNKTFRQSIINGQSRTEFFVGKCVALLALCVGATMYYAIVTSLIGLIATEAPDLQMILDGGPYILRFFIMCLGYLSFAMLIGLVIRSSGIAILLYWSYVLFIEPFIRWVVHREIALDESILYYPMNIVEDLLPMPFFEFASAIPSEVNFDFLIDPNLAIGLTLALTAIFVSLAYWNMLAKDM
ncbi:histidine kinase [Portibacter marinus]|uniref:ABC transporter permease subunit n=1 Tax=Portibacter marinus TaxID=2898660 RepID=UPI001F21466C|nr:ABC transporter permease subunit [Portibacter marinus]